MKAIIGMILLITSLTILSNLTSTDREDHGQVETLQFKGPSEKSEPKGKMVYLNEN
jgi:hypothetical protein